MAVIKCKMCGGDLNLNAGSTVAECEYCGSVQTVPSADNEKKLTLFSRANRLRLSCEFDKAAGVYEAIVADFPEEAEAYWGLVLCKYGIEYVDDPATGKKIPTCHRSSFDSIMEDSDFEQALENADVVARKVYRDEAKAIEEIRKGIIEVSAGEEPYDIFICYKETAEDGQRTLDSVLAQDLYDTLTDKGYRVFFARITLEEKLGQEYEPYIFAALNSAKIMLAIGTDYEYYNAVWVKNEWSRYLKLMTKDKEKHLIPCYKGIDAYDMPKEFNKLQAQDLGKVGATQDLLRGIEKLLPRKVETVREVVRETVVTSGTVAGPTTQSLLDRGNMALEDQDWEAAKGFFNEVLNTDSRCALAYLGVAMSEQKFSDRKKFVLSGNLNSKPYQRAKQFADEALLQELESWENESKNRLVIYREKIKPAQNIISAGYSHTVGVNTDGRTLVTIFQKAQYSVGENYGQCAVGGWKDIVAISAGSHHTIGLKADGTVIATKYTDSDTYRGQCEVSNWTNIVAISAGLYHTVGLNSYGTVEVTQYTGDMKNYCGQCAVGGWRDIVAISAANFHTIGLKADGTVVAVGDNEYGQCNVSNWENIVAISAGSYYTVGLKADGTVIATKYTGGRGGQCDVSGWSNIVAISAGSHHTIGLKADGTVVAVGDNEYGQCNVSNWENIVAISAGSYYTVGLKADGTLVATEFTKNNFYNGQCDVKGWKLFDNIDVMQQEREKARERAIEQKRLEEERKRRIAEAQKAEAERERLERIAYLHGEKRKLQTELANLKGLFTGKRRKEIEQRLVEIENRLRRLNG